MTVRSLQRTAPLSVSHYDILSKAGSGNPDAHRARDTETDTLVAVHLFPDTGAKRARLIDRLSAEFQALAPLEHPNILRVLDFGQEGDFGYFVTEWVEGTTLAKMIEAHARLPEGNVIRILAQVGQGMDYARTGDTVPCRIDPARILLRNDGTAKIIPFASAEARAAKPALPMSALLKPEFAAEMAKADALAVPSAELIFSLGTTLHEAITGVPWAPPPPPPPPGTRRRSSRTPRLTGLTERAERAIRRATDPSPAKRPATCAEFLKLLRSRSLTAGTPKPDTRPTTEAVDNRRASVRYALGVGSHCTINRSLFDSPEPPVSDARELWPLVVQDVSVSGIGILLARRCGPGTELLIEVAIGTKTRSLPVRVVCVRKDNLGHWMHGCEFFTPLDEPELAVLLAQFGRADSM